MRAARPQFSLVESPASAIDVDRVVSSGQDRKTAQGAEPPVRKTAEKVALRGEVPK